MITQVYSEQGARQETFPVDSKAYYVFGRDSSVVDILLTGADASRTHAALVHHEDGKSYLIDLQSVPICTEAGFDVCCAWPSTFAIGFQEFRLMLPCRERAPLSGAKSCLQTSLPCLLTKLPLPLERQNRSTYSAGRQLVNAACYRTLLLCFDNSKAPDTAETILFAGSKRKADAVSSSNPMQSKQTVRASHLLVKHRYCYACTAGSHFHAATPASLQA